MGILRKVSLHMPVCLFAVDPIKIYVVKRQIFEKQQNFTFGTQILYSYQLYIRFGC